LYSREILLSADVAANLHHVFQPESRAREDRFDVLHGTPHFAFKRVVDDLAGCVYRCLAGHEDETRRHGTNGEKGRCEVGIGCIPYLETISSG
jgi:hypothetical protein